MRSAYARPISRPVGSRCTSFPRNPNTKYGKDNYTVAIRALEYNLRAREIAAGKRVISIEHGFGGRDLVVVKEENLQSDCDSGTGVYEGHDEEELEEDMDSMEYDESSDLD